MDYNQTTFGGRITSIHSMKSAIGKILTLENCIEEFQIPVYGNEIIFCGIDQFHCGDVAYVEGAKNNFNGHEQIRPTNLFTVPGYFLPKLFTSGQSTQWHKNYVIKAIKSLKNSKKNKYYDAICELIGSPELNDEKFNKFLHARASIGYHGDFAGGLVVHIANMLLIWDCMKSGILKTKYDVSGIDDNLMKFCILAHDAGKVKAYQETENGPIYVPAFVKHSNTVCEDLTRINEMYHFIEENTFIMVKSAILDTHSTSKRCGTLSLVLSYIDKTEVTLNKYICKLIKKTR